MRFVVLLNLDSLKFCSIVVLFCFLTAFNSNILLSIDLHDTPYTAFFSPEIAEKTSLFLGCYSHVIMTELVLPIRFLSEKCLRYLLNVPCVKSGLIYDFYLVKT